MTAESGSYTVSPPHLAGSVRAPRLLFPFTIRTRGARVLLSFEAASALA